MIRPGWQTSEFWLTLALTIVAAAVAFGIVSPADKAGLEGAMAKAIEAVAALLSASAAIYRYTVSRETVKVTDPPESTPSKGE